MAMNAIPPSFDPRADEIALIGEPTAHVSGPKWAALQGAANVVAGLAGLEPEQTVPEIRDFPSLIGVAEPWRRELAERGIEQMAAVMEPGIAALLGVNARGADPRAAALALWHEFEQARASVLALLPPGGASGPRHNA